MPKIVRCSARPTTVRKGTGNKSQTKPNDLICYGKAPPKISGNIYAAFTST